MTRRLLFGNAADSAVTPDPLPGDGDGDGGGTTDPTLPGWPATDDPILTALRPSGTRTVATITATPGDSMDALTTTASAMLEAALETPYGTAGPDHGVVILLPPGQYVGGFGTSGWLSIVGTTGNPEDVVIFSDTIAADGVAHPFSPVHIEGVTLKAGYNADINQSPKYCAHVRGTPRSTFANVIFDAADAMPGAPEWGNSGSFGIDSNPETFLYAYKCTFIKPPSLTGTGIRYAGGPQSVNLTGKAVFLDCTLPDGVAYGGPGSTSGNVSELYVVGGTLGGNIDTDPTTQVYTDHDNPVVNPGGLAVLPPVRGYTTPPVPADGAHGLTEEWLPHYYPSVLLNGGTQIIRAAVTDTAPMAPVPGRTYYAPVPIISALWINRTGIRIHTGAGKTINWRPQPDFPDYYGSSQPGNYPVVEGFKVDPVPAGEGLMAFYYSWIMYPSAAVGGNRLWFHFRFDDAAGVTIDGSADLPGLYDCYYSDDEGATIVKATAGTPFPLAHAAQVR